MRHAGDLNQKVTRPQFLTVFGSTASPIIVLLTTKGLSLLSVLFVQVECMITNRGHVALASSESESSEWDLFLFEVLELFFRFAI